jgi:hypothetical protein
MEPGILAKKSDGSPVACAVNRRLRRNRAARSREPRRSGRLPQTDANAGHLRLYGRCTGVLWSALLCTQVVENAWSNAKRARV